MISNLPTSPCKRISGRSGTPCGLELGTRSVSAVWSLGCGVGSFRRPPSVPVRVNGRIAAALQVGQQVQNLVFREGIQQTDRQRRTTLGLSCFDVGFLQW